MKHFSVVLLVALSFLLASCAEMNKGQTGAAGGAAGGALLGQIIGHNTESTLIGAAVGGLIGYIVGNEMDKYDRQQLNHVYERGVSGNTSAWVNPDNGNQYMVTPKPAYTGPQDRWCRQAEIDAVIDGKRETTYATACRDEYGHWVLQQ